MYMYFSNVWNILQQKLIRIHSLKGQILPPFVHAVKYLMLQMDINFFYTIDIRTFIGALSSHV